MQTKKKLSIAKSEDLASLPTEYILYIDEALKTQKHFSETNLSKKLIRKWTDVHEDDKEYFRDPYHKLIFPFLEKRKDLYVPLAPPPVSVAVSEAILLHCVNHVLKSTARIRKNNKRLSESKPDEKFSGQQYQFLDQGFTRPKVLLLAPFQSDAYDLIETIIRIVPDSQKVE
ncbi:hypothetical protein MHBO_001856 [Bonamia ostreae]|uniref:UTP25 NTP hydrolase-like domain-containing protein n=1 Tax=Bonamia ostreae TaxID=126728 RepID=A0ABV2AKF1_9EUKA